jgi:hypothetical protein
MGCISEAVYTLRRQERKVFLLEKRKQKLLPVADSLPGITGDARN